MLVTSSIKDSFAYSTVLEDADNNSCSNGVIDEVWFINHFSFPELELIHFFAFHFLISMKAMTIT